MTAATVQAAVALAAGELAGELVWFEAPGLLAPQAASANVVRAKAVRTGARMFKVGLIGRSPYTEATLSALATQAALRPDRGRRDGVELPHRQAVVVDLFGNVLDDRLAKPLFRGYHRHSFQTRLHGLRQPDF
jgi:hypothetical protein